MNMSFRSGLALAGMLAALPALADIQFTVRRMTRNDVPLGKGQCDIRLQVDGEAEVSLRGNQVHVRTISGRDARDDGSECNEPLPARGVQGFNYEVKDSRGDIVLLAQPDFRNGGRAIVRIRDSKGGEGRYHFRISWDMTGGGYGSGGGARPLIQERPGFGRSPAGEIRFAGHGVGAYQRAGFRAVRLNDARIDVQRGRAHVAFQAEDGRPLVFNGSVLRAQGDTLICEMGGRGMEPHGTMYIWVDRGSVSRINMDGNAGRDRFRLSWRR